MLPSDHDSNALDGLLKRADIWRGFTLSLAAGRAVDTGFTPLNAALLHGGWPVAALIEVSQQTADVSGASAEWQLLLPALRNIQGVIVLLNPPAQVCAQGLIQAGLDLNRVLVVQSHDKSDFIKSFVELARTAVCEVLMAWSPRQTLSYTDLRKCALARSSGRGLCVLFRSAKTLQQSSPVALRLSTQWQLECLELRIHKQKGVLVKATQVIAMPVQHLPQSLWSRADFAEDGTNPSVQPVRRVPSIKAP